MKKIDKTDKFILIAFSLCFIVAIGSLIAITPTLRQKSFRTSHQAAIMSEYSKERELTEKFTSALKDAGVGIDSLGGFTQFNSEYSPVRFVVSIGGKYEAFSLKEVDLSKTIKFDTKDWVFENA